MKPGNEKTSLKRNTRENIIDAAIELFSEKGFSEASIRDITGRIGLRESAVYTHFANKSELNGIILEMFTKEVSMEAYTHDNISSHITELGPKLFLQTRLLKLRDSLSPRTIKVWRIMHIEQFRNKEVRNFYMEEILNRPVAFYEKVFESMLEKGLIKPYDARILATEYYYTIVAILLERGLLEVDKIDVSPAIKKLFEHVEFFYEAIKI